MKGDVSMKKSTISLFSLVLVLIMTVVLTGCSSNKSADSGQTGGSSDKAQSNAANSSETPSPEPPELQPEENPPSQNTDDSIELSGYMNEESLPSMVQELGLTKAEGEQFGELGERFEGNGISVEWQPSSGTNPSIPITVQCSDNYSVSMQGVSCGYSYEDTKSSLLKNGWRAVGTDTKHPNSFLMETDNNERFLISLTLDSSDSVSEWDWCNWPQGNLVVQ